jgi:hypothetical protein
MPPQAAKRPLEAAVLWALIIVVILAAVAVTPWNAVAPAATKAFVLGAGAIVALALYIFARLSRGSIVLPPALLVGALWLPALAYLLSAAFSGASFSMSSFGAALDTDTFGFILAASVLGSLFALVPRRSEEFLRAFRILGWVFAALAALQLLILIAGQFIPGTISPAFSLFGSLGELGGVAGLALVLALLALRVLPQGAAPRRALLILGLLALCLLALADSPILWTLVALAALAFFVEAVMRRAPAGAEELEGAALLEEERAEPGGERSLAAPLVALAVSLFFLIGGTLGNGLVSALHVSTINVRPSWQSTLATGGAAYAASPVFGPGPDTFGAHWLLSRNAALNETPFSGIDFTAGIGFIPTSFVTTGLVGALAWLLFLGCFLYFGARTLLLRAPEEPPARFALLAAFLGFVYLAALAVFSVPGPFTLALLFIFAGLFASAARYARGASQWGVIFGRSPRVGFVIVFSLTLLLLASIAAAYLLVERYVALVEVARAERLLSRGDFAGASAAAARALAFAPSTAAYEAQSLAALGQMNSIASDTTLSQSAAQQQFQAALSSGINAALTATQLAPADYTAWLSLGNLYAAVVPLNVAGAYDSAKSAYDKAAAENPTAPSIPYLEAQLEIGQQNLDAAKSDLKQAIALQASDTQAILLLSQLEVASGDVATALADAEAAAYFTPNDPNVLYQIGVLEAAAGDVASATAALSAAVAANPQFANARYLLAAAYAKQGQYADALAQVQAIAALSDANAQAVAADLSALAAGRDPFPTNLLAATSTGLSQ